MTSVAVALMEREGAILICRRRRDQLHGGKWEFPGGKVEPGESPRSALQRELEEELSIEVLEAEECLRYDFSYAEGPTVHLVFFLVSAFEGEIDGSQFAEVCWEVRRNLPRYDFLEGDARVVSELAKGRHGDGAA